jgi:phosphate starvation-inducible protein PhoH
MLQINFIRENTELVKQKLAKKHVKNIDDIGTFTFKDSDIVRNAIITKILKKYEDEVRF